MVLSAAQYRQLIWIFDMITSCHETLQFTVIYLNVINKKFVKTDWIGFMMRKNVPNIDYYDIQYATEKTNK